MHVNRRDMIVASGALAAAASAGSQVLAAGDADHAHHHFAKGLNQPLLAAMSQSVQAGQVCLHHCVESMKAGDTTLAKCLAAVQDMVAVCTAGGALTAFQSPFLKDLLKVSLQVCEACEAECRKHAQTHPECKACGEACVACITATRSALAT